MKRIPPKAELRATQHAIRALDHPIRQRILGLLLIEGNKVSYSDIVERLTISDTSAIAHHLKVLVGAALVGNTLERVGGRMGSLYFITELGEEWLSRVGFASPERARILLSA